MGVTDRWIEIAEGLLVRRHAELDLSLGLVVGDGECLVVDTGGDAHRGAEFAAAVREVTPHPWRVVLTHSHFDHSFGTEAFGPCEVWAQRGCRAALVADGATQRARWAAHYREEGRPDVAERVERVNPVLPDRLVDARAELSVGGRRVDLLHLGPGHTGHDLVVHVPDASAVFAGDLVEQGAPPQFHDADPPGWPVALDALLSLGAAVVLPGHGDPVDRDLVREQRREIADVAALCAAVAAGELGVAEALARSPYPEEFTRPALARVTSGRTSPP
ncbi:MBL fold metallo-hydrolase [Umezawaea beigongshangensis]|uniref:MBL fold metallo-hydrolase n=1 Tax=Umezawaea beigongshangensis TaxID=2780383 RepID=UPI0018F1AC59